MYKRLLSLLLAMLMLFSISPVTIATSGDVEPVPEGVRESSDVEDTSPSEETADTVEAAPDIQEVVPDIQNDSTEYQTISNDTITLNDFSAGVVRGAVYQDGKWVWAPATESETHRFVFRVSYSTSGIGSIEAEELQIRIPKQVLVNRNGDFADEFEMSIPYYAEIDEISDPHELEEIDLVYKIDGDDIVVYNYQAMSAAQNGYFEVSYATTEKMFYYVDMGDANVFNASINITTGNTLLSLDINNINVYLDTSVTIHGTEKHKPVVYYDWENSWGPTPENSSDYIYMIWEIKSTIKAMQPYNFIIDDSILQSTEGGVEVIGYRFSGQSVFSDLNYVTNSTLNGYRYDYVLTRQPKSLYDPLDIWRVLNKEVATVHPYDGVDPDTSATATKDFQFERPNFSEPTGSFNAYKNGDGAYRRQTKIVPEIVLGFHNGNYSRYDLQDFKEGLLTKYDDFDYAVWFKGYPYPWTVPAGADHRDPENFGIVPVTYRMIDEGIFLDYDLEYSDALTYNDFQFDFFQYAVVMKDAQYNDTTKKFDDIPVTYTEDDILYFYGKFEDSDEWVLIATNNLYTRERWSDPEYVVSFSQSKVVLQDNCVAYKIETSNAHFYTAFYSFPNLSLKPSEYVMDFIGDRDHIGILNKTKGIFLDNDGNELVNVDKEDTDYARCTQKNSYLEKKVVASTNFPRKKAFSISWRIKAEELATFGEGSKEYVNQESGVFYDLLPEGCTLDLDSISVQGVNGFLSENSYTVRQIPNYKNSGRTLAIFTMKVPDDFYYLYFDTIHPWDSIKDYGSGIYNPVAYETGNNTIAQGYPDNGGIANTEDNYDWNDEDVYVEHPEFTELFTDLDTTTDDEKFIYADEYFDINAITAAAAGLTKKVKSEADLDYSYSTWTTVNGDYQYRLRFMNTHLAQVSGITFFDSLENFSIDDMSSDWHGTLQSIDLSQLTEKGIAPKVYISEIENLNLEGETNFKDNNDVTNEDVWYLVDENTDLSKAKAIAIDVSKKSDDSDYYLDSGESVVAVLHFKAPAFAESENKYPETYNNVYIKDTLVDAFGHSHSFFIHQDYTTVKYIVTGDVKIKKVSSENESVYVPGIKFKLYGISDYGTDIVDIKTTDVNGEIHWSNIEKGTYILQEYETNDDWLFDGTEYTVVIDGGGNLFVNGLPVDSFFRIANTPRIHGDLSFGKIAEDLSRDWETPEDSAGDDAPVDDEEDPVEEESTVVSSQAEPSVEYESGIPNTTFKLYGTSYYGNEIAMLATSNNVGRVEFRNVEKGTYTLEEVIVNPAFVKNNTKWTVTIDDQGNASIHEPTDVEDKDRLYFVTQTGTRQFIENENRSWDFKLYKVDSYNPSIYLEGAQFNLIGTSDFGTEYNITETTNSQGYIQFMNLEKGSYILRELVAPTGVDEHGQLGGNRNYILNAKTYIVTINERGIVSIDGASLTEDGQLAILNDRAMDGTITITKIWNDYSDENRPIPKLHLSTKEIAVSRNLTINVHWAGEEDSADTRPYQIKLYIGMEDGTPITDKTFVLSAPENPTILTMSALLDPKETYYVWADNARGYGANTSVDNKDLIEIVDGKNVGDVTFTKYPPTILVPGATFKSRVPRTITSFTQAYEMPAEGTELITLSTDTSGVPVYGWVDGTDFYWYSDADIVYMNPNSVAIFQDCKQLTSLDLNMWNASKVTSLNSAFSGCSLLGELHIENWNTQNLVNLGGTFKSCSKLENLDLSQWNVNNVTNMSSTFMYCHNLQNLNLTGWQTGRLTQMDTCFHQCHKVQEIDLRGFNTSGVTSFYHCFGDAYSATLLGVEDLDVSSATNTACMFWRVKATNWDLSGWDVSKLQNASQMFIYSSISEINVSGWNLAKCTNMSSMFNGCTNLQSIDLSSWNCPVLTNVSSMFYNCKKLSSINMNGWNAPRVQSLASMFTSCTSLESISFEDANFGAITSINSLFNGCSKLTTIDWADLDMSGLTNMGATFKGCSSLEANDLSGMQTGNVTSMAELFSGCNKLIELDVSGFDTHSVTSMKAMFYNCSKLTELDVSNFNTSSVTNMESMFNGCAILTEIDVSNFNTQNVTTMAYMFSYCKSLLEIDVSGFDTRKVTAINSMFLCCENASVINIAGWQTPSLVNMNSAFYSCFAISSLDFSTFDTSHVTNMTALFQHDRFTSIDLSSFDTSSVVSTPRMFYSCRQCTTIYVSEKWNMDNVTDSSSMFAYCPSLPNYISSENDKTHANYDVGGYLTYKAAPIVSNPGSLIITKPSGAVFFPVGVQERALNDFEDVNEDPTAITDVPDLPMDETDPEPDIAGGTFQGLDWCITSDGELIIGAEGETQTIPQNTSRSKAFFPWHAYASQVNSISFIGSVTTTWQMVYAFADLRITEFNSTNLDTSNVTNFGETFMGCSKLQHFDFAGMDTTKVTSTYEMFSGCSSLETVDLSDFVGAPLKTTAHMFSGCSKLNNINFTNFNTSNVNDMKGMFKDCSSLISLDLTMLNTSNVTNMGDMFYNCSMLSTIDVSSLNTSKVTTMANVFDGCASIETLDLSSWNTEKVTTMAGMFNRCKKLVLLNVSGFDTSKVTTMASMFSGCSSLTSLDLTPLNTENVTTMASMFSGCSSLTSLDLTPLNTENVTTMASMFNGCSALTGIDLSAFNTSNVTNMSYMFNGCSKLDNPVINSLDVSKVTTFAAMFNKCSALKTLDIHSWNPESLKSVSNMFYGCSALETIVGDLSNFDVAKFTDVGNFFYGCSKLEEVDCSNWDTSNLASMLNVFAGCSSLKKADVRYWNTDKVTGTMQYMFSGCRTLEELDFTNWNTTRVSNFSLMLVNLNNLKVIRFGEKNVFTSNASLGGSWIHKTDKDGNRLYSQSAKTGAQILAMSPEERAGKWVKNGYIPSNSLGDGDYEYISEDLDWVKNGNVWTYTFEVFDDSIPYYLYEEPIEGYTSSAMETYISINADGNITKEATIVNTAVVKTGSLEISKSVVGTTTNQKFNFTVVLSGPAIQGVQVFSDVIFNNGVATIQLADNETKVFGGIPIGTTYSVVEATPNNYSLNVVGNSGVIASEVTSSAVFINNYIPPVLGTTNLILAKEVVGEYDTSANYNFVLQFSNMESNTTYATSDPNISFTTDGSGAATFSVLLTAETSIEFIGLPIGTKYSVTEEAGEYISSYRVVDANGGSKIVSSARENSSDNLLLSTAVETANENEAVTITFLNTIHHTSNLKLRKVVDSPYPEDNGFEFTITLQGLAQGTKLNSTVGRFMADEDGTAYKTITLKDNGVVEIYNIPVGVVYTISESANKYQASYQVEEIQDGVTSTVMRDGNVTQNLQLLLENGVIHEHKDVEVTFKNTYYQPGSITITKVMPDGTPMHSVPMRLEYSKDNGSTWSPISKNTNTSSDIYPVGTCTNDDLVDGVLRTGSDGVVTFTGLDKEASVLYRIIEVGTNNGSSLLIEPVMVGSLPVTEVFESEEDLQAFISAYSELTTDSNDFKVDADALSVEISHVFYTLYNNNNILIPETGGHGIGYYPFFSLMLLGLLVSYMYIRKKKEEL